MCSDSSFDITSALEIAKSGAILVSDRKVKFSRNLECALADVYGHYSSRDLHLVSSATAFVPSASDQVRKGNLAWFRRTETPVAPNVKVFAASWMDGGEKLDNCPPRIQYDCLHNYVMVHL